MPVDELAKERYDLAVERIREIREEKTVAEPYLEFFTKTAGFLEEMICLRDRVEAGEMKKLSLEELRRENTQCYQYILPENYPTSYASPDYAAKMLGVDTVVGFTGSSIWHYLYSFPPVTDAMIQKGYDDFARRFTPILDEFQKLGVRFALEVHPTEIAFDTFSARRALEAVNNHPAFGFNYDPSHLGYQGVDYVDFIYQFPERIFHVHMKDVYWSDTPKQVGIFGGHVTFGDPRRYWNFRSLGRGKINFEEIIRALNSIGYQGPLSVEWEDSAMDREHGARESCELVKRVDFQPSAHAFDACFGKE